MAALVVGVVGAAAGCTTPEDPTEPGLALPDDADLPAVQAWLVEGHYLAWERYDPPPDLESGMSGGARVYLSPELAASLRAGSSSHPVGAAAVREIINLDQAEAMVGWAYTHKLALPDNPGENADAWFFYEVFSLEREGEPLVAERGAPGCVGCHEAGLDFVRSQLE